MGKFIDLSGKSFGRLKVLHRAVTRKSNKKTLWKCLCFCGNECTVDGGALASGRTQSCGCLRREVSATRGKFSIKTAQTVRFKHGCEPFRLYKIWTGMKNRCFNPKNKDYQNYGGRGIEVCSEWCADFKIFRDWALSNGYAENLSIERINNNLGYSPSNCTWIPIEEQQKNKRTSHRIHFNGEEHSLAEWSSILGICASTLSWRYRHHGTFFPQTHN